MTPDRPVFGLNFARPALPRRFSIGSAEMPHLPRLLHFELSVPDVLRRSEWAVSFFRLGHYG